MVRRARVVVERLAREHWDRLYRIAYGVLGDQADAEEATQEALLKVLRHCSAAGIGEGSSGGRSFPAQLLPFAARVVRNTALDEVRRRQVRREALAVREAEAARAQRKQGTPAEAAEQGELAGALRHLPAEQELVVMLHCFDGWTFRRIAKELGEKESAVSMRYYRALERLRAHLSPDFGGDAHGT